jgi:hypothetical protein
MLDIKLIATDPSMIASASKAKTHRCLYHMHMQPSKNICFPSCSVQLKFATDSLVISRINPQRGATELCTRFEPGSLQIVRWCQTNWRLLQAGVSRPFRWHGHAISRTHHVATATMIKWALLLHFHSRRPCLVTVVGAVLQLHPIQSLYTKLIQ